MDDAADPVLEPLRQVAPDIEIVTIPYLEDPALRSARGTGEVSPELLATAPTLSTGQLAELRRVETVLAMDLPDALYADGTELRWIQAAMAGVERLRVSDLAARGIAVTTAAGIAADSIAEFVMGRLLEVWKHTRALEADQRARRWKMRFGERAAGKTIGVVGLGAIGRAVARRARAFDMHVVATRRSAQPGDRDPAVDQLLPAGDLDDMLAQCDAVVISAPATPETENLFDRDRLAAVKPGAILCNVARGSLVDEDALVEALESGHLRAAILDVTRIEPTPPDSPLWDQPDVYLSSHSSTSLDGYGERVIELFAANLARYLDGRPLHNLADPATH